MSRKILLALAACLLLFLALRLPGIGLPYHQDEWKNVAAAADPNSGPYWTHPPLFQIVFRAGNTLVGQDHFRVLPLLFSIGSFVLLYFIVRKRSGTRAALFSVFFFSICFYNVLGSLMPDVDGAIIPFFFLLSVYLYDKWNDAEEKQKKQFFTLLILSLLVGFLIKLNFVLVIGALLTDYVWNHRQEITVKKLLCWFCGGALFTALYVALLYIIQAIYPSFTIAGMLGHANQFAPDVGREYLQIVVQGIKAVYYLSPLLLVPLVLMSKKVVLQTRIFLIYIIFGLFFYLILFDFSRGALDKYLMFLIVPLSVLVGTLCADIFREQNVKSREDIRNGKWSLGIGVLLSLLLLSLNFVPQAVAALYPKTEWFARILHGHWNVLTPLTGGSGPLGFYVSFLFIATSFFVSFVVVLVAMYRPQWKRSALTILILIGLTYNGVFAEELLFGKINGNVAEALTNTIAFVAHTDSIQKVLTYNDSGAAALVKIGKYGGRFYATPTYEQGHKEKFAVFDGAYMVIDIPHLYENGFYGQFFSNCKVLYETTSGRITGRVYDCNYAKALLNQ